MFQCRWIFVLIFMCLPRYRQAIEVQFQPSYPSSLLHSHDLSNLYKRNLEQFFDKATYRFNGLTRIASVPVAYPLDICILQLPSIKYATALHKNHAGQRMFSIYGWKAAVQQYELLMEMPSPLALSLDCLSHGGRGYAALTYNLTASIGEASEGSPIYELSPERGIRIVQYFAARQLRSMYLRISSQELTLLLAYSAASAANTRCPYFKWTEGTFQRLGHIPCSNARRLEAFDIDYDDFVAVANYANAQGHTATHSEVYKYNAGTKRFELFQRLRSNGAVDVKYFSVPQNEVTRRHFLILGNTVGRAGGNGEADTVIYVYDKGQFVPYQSLSFYAVQRFLPLQHAVEEKFLLLVACSKQDVKIYNLNDWKFEESTVQFTEGALSRGVTKLRSYEEADQSYLVIANENMVANETNIFLPLYKQDEHANVLRQQIIDWARAQSKRLQQQNVEQLLQAVQSAQHKLQGSQSQRIKLVNTQTLVDAGLKLDSNYWDALQYATRAMEVIEQQASKIHGQPQHKRLSKRQAQKPRQLHEFEDITVHTLVVHDKLQAAHINGLDVAQPHSYKSINASKVYVSSAYNVTSAATQLPKQQQLHVVDLQLAGTLNGYNWTQLLEQTLKRNGSDVQFIKAHAVIGNLKAEAVSVNDKEVSGQQLSQLIAIDGGDYVVQQQVQFAAPLKVKQLEIHQRLNNIAVDRQRLDVLLKQANETQVIVAAKQFKNVRVLEPITMQGRMLGAELRAMSPLKVTHRELHLFGDYVINGDVTIGKVLSAKDLLNARTQQSAVQAFEQGIRLAAPIEHVNMQFEQPLGAKHTELSFINAQDLQHLVKLNVNEVQLIKGAKHFPQSLEIHGGFGEVEELNGIQVKSLEQQLLLQHSNQTIEVPMQLGGLTVAQLQAEQVLLNGIPLEHYLTTSTEQHSKGTLYVDQIEAQQLSVQDLHMNGELRIFGHSLNEIYQNVQKPKFGSSFELPPNYNGTLYAKNLWLKGHINNVNISHLAEQLQQLAGNIKYVGDFSFQRPLNITSLQFDGTLNGIPAEQFGNCWLETTGDQNFTAAQTLAHIESRTGIELQGKLNNYTLSEYVSGTYRLNESETIQAMKFENPIVLQASLDVGKMNGLRIPEDMLYTDGESFLQAPLTVNGSMFGSALCNVSSLNGMHLETLQRYLSTGNYDDTLHVENLQFEQAPSYATLNSRNLEQLLDEVWLENEPIVLGNDGQQVRLASASFEGLLDFQGTVINGMDLAFIKNNYVSRTRSQRLNVALNFRHDVTFEQRLTVNNVQLRGDNNNAALVEGIGNNSIDFDAFVANTLKTAGPHAISAQWSMLEAQVPGDLQNVQINQLNLVNDVIRTDVKGIQTISATKTVRNADIKRLSATPTSTVANVPVAQWINDTVYVYGNHTIKGTTMIDTLNLYNDLCVEGPVNGIQWHPNNLLLRDKEQQIAGMLRIQNTLQKQQRILTNNIEGLWVDQLNGRNVNELLANKASNRPDLHVESHLVFTQPLTVQNYQAGDRINHKWKREMNSVGAPNGQELAESVAYMKQRLTSPPYMLGDFIIRQQLPLNVSHVEILSVQDMDVLAVWHSNNTDSNRMDYYNWQTSQQMFVHNATLSSLLPQNRSHLEYYKAGFGQLWKQLNVDSTAVTPLHLSTLNCLATFNKIVVDAAAVLIYCIHNGNLKQQAVIENNNVKQLLALDFMHGAAVLALLCPNEIEFWHCNEIGICKQHNRLVVLHAQQIALVMHEDHTHLAVLTLPPGKPQAAVLNIYSTVNTDLAFHLNQVIDFDADTLPLQLQFMQLPKSNDLLLCMSTTSLTQPLRIYVHQGILGFRQKVGASILPAVQSLHPLQLKKERRQFLALVTASTDGGIYVVEPQFKRL